MAPKRTAKKTVTKRKPATTRVVDRPRIKVAMKVGQIIKLLTQAGITTRYLGASCWAIEQRRVPPHAADSGHTIVIAFDEEDGELEGIFTRWTPEALKKLAEERAAFTALREAAKKAHENLAAALHGRAPVHNDGQLATELRRAVEQSEGR
jgi:hypothetical protein